MLEHYVIPPLFALENLPARPLLEPPPLPPLDMFVVIGSKEEVEVEVEAQVRRALSSLSDTTNPKGPRECLIYISSQ